ncbi:amidase, partial [Streptomyces sp. SID10244]|nr:amidase [Streptomyces sp. SID10244]
MTTETAVDQSLSRYDDYAWTNVFVHVDADEVRAEATVARPGPLHGDLFSVKDLFAVAGVPSRGGSLVLDDFRPDVDATAVARARQAGAVFFGKTNCAEFGFGIDTETRLGGRVLHPTRDDLSPG